MNEEEAGLDSATLPTQEFVARTILRRFPEACLKTREAKSEVIYEIYFQDSLLLSLDKKGARYFFPTCRKRVVKWERITTAGLPRTIEYILRDLAEANYEVLSATNKQVLKRPIHISRLMRCPECKEGGGIKIIVIGESLAEENSQIYTAITPADHAQGAEIKCTHCGWIGIRGQLLRRARRSS